MDIGNGKRGSPVVPMHNVWSNLTEDVRELRQYIHSLEGQLVETARIGESGRTQAKDALELLSMIHDKSNQLDRSVETLYGIITDIHRERTKSIRWMIGLVVTALLAPELWGVVRKYWPL